MTYYQPSLHILLSTRTPLKEKRVPLSNLTGVAFLYAFGKRIKVLNIDSRPADLTYFTFRSSVLAKTVDCHAPKNLLTLEISLRLPQSLSPSVLVFTATSLNISTLSSIPKPPHTVVNLGFTLCNLPDDILLGTTPDELHNLVITARDTITKLL